jgi:hypothetical protein
MSSLADFAKEYRSKTSSNKTFSVASIGENVRNTFRGYLQTDANADDTEALTDTPSTSGTLPAGKNR